MSNATEKTLFDKLDELSDKDPATAMLNIRRMKKGMLYRLTLYVNSYDCKALYRLLWDEYQGAGKEDEEPQAHTTATEAKEGATTLEKHLEEEKATDYQKTVKTIAEEIIYTVAEGHHEEDALRIYIDGLELDVVTYCQNHASMFFDDTPAPLDQKG